MRKIKFKALELKENPVGDHRMPWVFGGVAALAAGFFGWQWWSARHITITAATTTNAITIPSGGTLTINPPAGATWVGQLNPSITASTSGGSGTAPLVMANITSGGTVALSWTDSSGIPSGGTVTVSVS